MSQPWQPNEPGPRSPHQGPQQPPAPQPHAGQQPFPPQAQPPRAQPPQQSYPPQSAPPQPFPQQPYPQQSYPQQPWPPGAQPGPGQFGQVPGAPAGPLTSPGWGTLPAALGVIATLVGMFALPWFSAGNREASFLDLWEVAENEGFALPSLYVVWLAFIALAILPLVILPWTLGALRTNTSARWLSGIRRHDLSHATFTKYRLVFAARAVAALIVHLMGIVSLYDGAFDVAGPGPWVLLAGCALATVGALMGPRKGPGLPPTSR